MPPPERSSPVRVGYVVKRYPRYSETFVVTEILAHEAAGLEIEIFSLLPPNDSHFQDAIARVRAPVRRLSVDDLTASTFWAELRSGRDNLPGLWPMLPDAADEKAQHVYQAALLARAVRD